MGGLNNLPGGHATPPLPAIVGSLQLSFHGLADDREIILRSINCGAQLCGGSGRYAIVEIEFGRWNDVDVGSISSILWSYAL
jgi:hypothetical protein